MKGTIANFVKTANNFLFFLGSILLILILAYQVYDANFRDKHRAHDSIKIVDSKNAKSAPIKFKKSFVVKYDDLYIFRVRSNRLLSSSLISGTIVESFNMFSGTDEYSDFETVNFLFTRTDSAPTLLLKSHALVLDYHLIALEPESASYGRQFRTSKHLFTVILNDDNQDRILDRKDKVDLIASDYDGTNMITIANDIDEYQIVDDNSVLISQSKEGQAISLIYNLGTGTSHTLDTILPSIEASK